MRISNRTKGRGFLPFCLLGLGALIMAACSDSPVGVTAPIAVVANRNITLSVSSLVVAPTGILLEIQGGRVDSVTAVSGNGLIVRRVDSSIQNGGGQFVLAKEGGIPAGSVSAVLWGPAGDGYSIKVVEAAGADFALVDPSLLSLQISK